MWCWSNVSYMWNCKFMDMCYYTESVHTYMHKNTQTSHEQIHTTTNRDHHTTSTHRNRHRHITPTQTLKQHWNITETSLKHHIHRQSMSYLPISSHRFLFHLISSHPTSYIPILHNISQEVSYTLQWYDLHITSTWRGHTHTCAYGWCDAMRCDAMRGVDVLNVSMDWMDLGGLTAS